jgi:hypothetical protein
MNLVNGSWEVGAMVGMKSARRTPSHWDQIHVAAREMKSFVKGGKARFKRKDGHYRMPTHQEVRSVTGCQHTMWANT